jgi:cold shock CspA family protein
VGRQAGQLLAQALQPSLVAEHSARPREARQQLEAYSGLYVVHQGGQDREGLTVQGVVKVYDPETGVGVIVRDDNQAEVLLGPGSLAGSLFRTLRQGQRVIFDTEDRDGVPYADRLRFGSDGY